MPFGILLTDQQHHNLAVPQLGPADPVSGLDFERFRIWCSSDLFKFRTLPPDVTATIHGCTTARTDLEDVVRHHVDPEDSLDDYDPYQQLFQSDLWDLVVQDEDLDEWMLESFEEDLESDDRDDEEDEDDDQNRSLSPKQIRLLIAFLDSLAPPRSAGAIALGCSIFVLADCRRWDSRSGLRKCFGSCGVSLGSVVLFWLVDSSLSK